MLHNFVVIDAMKRAWIDSHADDPARRHEEGGFFTRDAHGVVSVRRWQPGERGRISPPTLDSEGRYNGEQVIAAFHTHPNPAVDEKGVEWQQGPSQADIRWHLRKNIGGYVIARDMIFLLMRPVLAVKSALVKGFCHDSSIESIA